VDHDGNVPVDVAAAGIFLAPARGQREAAILRRQRGEAATEIAVDLGVSVRSVRRWWRQWQADGTMQRRRGSGRRPRITESLATELQTVLVSRPTTTRAELCVWLADTHHIVVSVPTMSRTLRRRGWRYRTLPHP
jgi:transposase